MRYNVKGFIKIPFSCNTGDGAKSIGEGLEAADRELRDLPGVIYRTMKEHASNAAFPLVDGGAVEIETIEKTG